MVLICVVARVAVVASKLEFSESFDSVNFFTKRIKKLTFRSRRDSLWF